MMLAKRIISTLLALLMVFSMFVITVGAEEAAPEKQEYTYNTTNEKPTIDYLNGALLIEEEEGEEGEDDGESSETPEEEIERDYIESEEEKLSLMDLRFEKDGYQLYVDEYSGEVAIKCLATGEILFTNPYAAGNSKIKEEDLKSTVDKSIKEQLLSQLVVKYTTISTDASEVFYSFSETIQGETEENPYPASQIAVKNIKNGIRVEYSIGREEARLLLPRQIKKETFETKLLKPMATMLGHDYSNISEASLIGSTSDKEAPHTLKRFRNYYNLFDPSTATPTEVEAMHKKYKITQKMAVYILDGNANTNIRNLLEGFIKTYCPDYSYEDLDEDHLEAEYESEDVSPPLFKMALEYTLDEHGVTVRLPANGIRFNETLYRLDSIEILPFMGSGMNINPGQVFYPDGSGTLFDFEEINDLGTRTLVTGKVYGQDYAYHTIAGTHQETIRYPVFGLNETEVVSETKVQTGTADDGTEIFETKVETKDRGFIAIVEEGDALMELSADFDPAHHPYNTVKMIVYPRPKDTYSLADSVSSSNSTWTVVSDRKYTGNYKVRYVMLTDDDLAKEKELDQYYTCNYVGMAKAYRDYLERNEILTKLTNDDVSKDIPIYIETFGAIETTKRILSVPVKTMLPLTTFAQVQKMHEELSDEGVDNINFILTGYNKGGLSAPVYPNKIDWEKSVGGEDGFNELLNYAKDEGIGIFPDFDYAFYANNNLTDGVTLKKHAIKTIDNRYTSKRVYSATKQSYMSYYELAISPAYYYVFYEALTEDYLKYDPIGISVSTIGTYLNSDFDEDEPYNREDSKLFTVEAFEYLKENYDKVMTSGGNAYTWQYVDYITDIALDSSRYSQSSASVPFLGIVLHGYVQLAGTPINMEGNTDYALLKAIESGASLNFILSYQNTSLLKNSETLSQYYSVRYDIWFNDVVNMYNELNSLLADVQTSSIADHKFITGNRIPDNDEILSDMDAKLKEVIEFEKELIITTEDEARQKLLDARKDIYSNATTTVTDLKTLTSQYGVAIGTNIETKLATLETTQQALVDAEADVAVKQAAYDAANEAYKNASAADKPAKKAERDAANTALKDAKTLVDSTKKDISSLVEAIQTDVNTIYFRADSTIKLALSIEQRYNQSVENMQYLKDNSGFSDEFLAEIETYVVSVEPVKTEAVDKWTAVEAYAKNIYDKVKDIEGITVEAYVAPELEPEKKPVVDAKDDENDFRYYSDDNKIVLITYENGKTFILNFNNFDITTTVGEVVYTVTAYGYVVIK